MQSIEPFIAGRDPRIKSVAVIVCVVTALGLPPAIARVQGDDDGSKTIVLSDPDHPLNGTWQYSHAAGTVVCPMMTVAIPPGNPEAVEITARDGGARLAISASSGRMDMQRVEIAQWKSESSGGMQVLRKTLRSDNAALMARALDGQATIYEGTQEPAADMTVRYIMGWAPDDPDTLRGHITSDFQGCTVTRAFMATRSR